MSIKDIIAGTSRVAKAVIAGLASWEGSYVVAVSDGAVVPSEWANIALGAVIAAFAVWAMPNTTSTPASL